jgi:hypothetical protein
MLPTDWSKPNGFVMARISDARAVQFWDEDHLVQKELRQQFPSSQPLCCQRDGILWDFVALYPAGNVEWANSTPVYFGGAVLDVASDVRQKLSSLSTTH